MNIIDIFKRAFRITRKNPKLWTLGFLAALNSAESGINGSFNFNVPSGGGSGTGMGAANETIKQVAQIVQDVLTTLTNNTGLLIGLISGLFCALLIGSLLVLLISEIARGGLIANVDRIEDDQKPSAGDGFRAGISRARALVGQKLLLGIPSLILSVAAIVAIVTAVMPIIRPALARGSLTGVPSSAFEGLLPTIIGVGLLALVGSLYNIVAQLLSQFGRRAIMLEDEGAIDGLKRGWAVIKANATNTLVMVLLAGIARYIVSIAIGIVLVLITVPAVIAILAATTSASEQFVIVFVLLGGILLVFLTVVSAVLGTLIVTFESSLWTLTYRAFVQVRTPTLV